MKKLISILLFSAICLGTKALESNNALIHVLGIHHMSIQTDNGKILSFEDKNMTFSACNYSDSEGYIEIRTRDDKKASYDKLKNIMNEIGTKIKATPTLKNNGWDKNGIYHLSNKTDKKLYGNYLGILQFQIGNIVQIDLY